MMRLKNHLIIFIRKTCQVIENKNNAIKCKLEDEKCPYFLISLPFRTIKNKGCQILTAFKVFFKCKLYSITVILETATFCPFCNNNIV